MRNLYTLPLFRHARIRTFLFLVFSALALFPKNTSAQTGISLSYDGTEDFLSLPNNVLTSVNQDFTIEAWVFWRNGSPYQRIFDLGEGIEKWMFLTPSTGGTNPVARFAITTTGLASPQILDADIAISPNTWTHVAVSIDHDANIGRIYINGEERGSATITLRPSDLGNTSQNWLGLSKYQAIYNDPFFNGNIDELRISNSVRYPENFLPQTSLFIPDANTVALYHFNEGSGQLAADVSSNGFTATLGGNLTAESQDPSWSFQSILPIDLLQMEVYESGKGVQLDWKAYVHGDGGNFHIERSKDGIRFTEIGNLSVPASEGTFSYQFTDTRPEFGTNYYRIRIAEFNKPVKYSAIVKIDLKGTDNYAVYPAAAKSEIFIKIPRESIVYIFNQSGALVQQLNLKESKSIPVQGLSKGIYVVRFENSQKTLRFIRL